MTEVRTQNYMGKRMKIYGTRQIVYAKRPDFKKAIVTFDGSLADTGLGGEPYGQGKGQVDVGQPKLEG